jgi:hypothetical protein
MKEKSKIEFAVKLMLAAAFGVFLEISPLTSFGDEVPEVEIISASWCQHNINGDSGLATFCQLTYCAHAAGGGSVVGPCGSDASLPPG